MKTILLSIALTLITVATVFAVEPSIPLEEQLRANQERKLREVAKFIVLKDNTKASFDSLYAEYQKALGALNDKYLALGYRLQGMGAVPTVEETKKTVREFRDLEVKKLDLKDFYYEKFAKILKPAQLIRLIQLETKADAIIRHQVATQIPFFE